LDPLGVKHPQREKKQNPLFHPLKGKQDTPVPFKVKFPPPPPPKPSTKTNNLTSDANDVGSRCHVTVASSLQSVSGESREGLGPPPPPFPIPLILGY